MTTNLATTAPPRRRRLGASTMLSNSTIWLVLAVVAAASLGPIAVIIRTSFGSGGEWTLAGWSKIFSAGILQAGGVSLSLCILSVLLTTVVATLAAFAFSQLRFPGSQTFLTTVVILMLVPGQVYLIPQFLGVANLVGLNSVPMTAVIYSAGQLPFSIFLLTNFFRSLPREILEAAIVDGASYPKALLSVFLPMAAPPLITIGVLNFIGVWNDLLTALLYLPAEGNRTIGVVLATAQSLRSFDVTMVMAGSLVSAVPSILVYIFFQRYITVGLTAGMGK